MFTFRSVYFAIEIWGCLLALSAAVSLIVSRDTPDPRERRLLIAMQINVGAILAADLIYWYTDARGGDDRIAFLYIATFFSYFLGYLGLILLSSYSLMPVEDRKKARAMKCIIDGLAAAGILMLIVSQFTKQVYTISAEGVYSRGPMYFPSQIVGVIGLILCFVMVFIFKEKVGRVRYRINFFYMVLLVAGLIANRHLTDISFFNLSLMAGSIIMYFLVFVQQSREIQREKREYSAVRIHMLQQQQLQYTTEQKRLLYEMHPHFLFNSLNTIYQLCDLDPSMAQKAVDDFSDYLRTTLNPYDSSSSTLIPFTKEMEHVEHYLALEKLRFGDLLKIDTNFQAMDFSVPSLLVQPLVENSVKHGIRSRENGGTVSIYTWREPDWIVICVQDSGVGFDPTTPRRRDDRVHIGVDSVRKSAEMLGGRLEYTSSPDKGTTATIHLPD